LMTAPAEPTGSRWERDRWRPLLSLRARGGREREKKERDFLLIFFIVDY